MGKERESIIEHPAHYCEGRKYEPKDVIRDWDLNFNLGNAVRQYLDFEINYLENNIKDKYPVK